MIKSVSKSDVLSESRRVLGLPDQGDGDIDGVLLAALLRRSAGIHCPCSRATLRASVLECTQALAADEAHRSQFIDDTIEALTVGGDLLELDDIVTEDTNVCQTWVFAAPPSFVIRPNGTAFVFGVVPDQDTFLPPSLGARVLYNSFTRSIEPREDENLADRLQEQSLQRISENIWFKPPRDEQPKDFLSRVDKSLVRRPPITSIDNFKILDSTRPVTYYPDRWITPTNHTGMFVTRRPQEFGAPMWCMIRLEDGAPTRLLDLPFEKTRWRACDTAWHIQMAIDHCRGCPQQYRLHSRPSGVRFDFFSPLPQWAQRRLMVFGNSVPRERCLFSYLVPNNQAKAEEEFLRSRLWLSRTDESG